MLVQQACLADVVEADIGQRQVLFQNRTMPTPLGIALTQHDRVVGQMEQVIVQRAHYMCPTSSGIS